jgi:EAL and modified HD-GYP domain-containing signal transduction protein
LVEHWVRTPLDAAVMTNIFLARQPILDHDQSVKGYELLYPDSDADQALVEDQALATARVALNALSEIGLENLVGDRRAWINVAPEFLSLDLVRNLPPERVVLELHGARFLDPSMLDLIVELRAAGYLLALDEFRYAAELEPLLELVDIVKVDMRALGARELARQTFKLRAHGLTLVAKKIETQDDFKFATAAGADLFQGYFFCRPHLIGGRSIPPSRLALMRLASALQDPTIELAELERLISGDVALSYRLLKYINSAYYGLRGRISSIKQTVALLGIEPMRRWATLTIFAEIGDKPRELFVTALIRAHFCQHAGRAQDGPPAELFTLGLFSVLDALTDSPMYNALQSLPLTPSMRDALIDHTGAGRLLDCVTAIEQGDFEHANEILGDSSQHYLESVAWSNDAAKQMIA